MVLVGLAKSFQKARHSDMSVKSWAKSLGSGGLTSTLVIVMNLIGPSLWVFGISVLIAINLMKARGIDVIGPALPTISLNYLKRTVLPTQHSDS